MKKIRCEFEFGKNHRPCDWEYQRNVLSYRATLRYDGREMSVDFHMGVCAGAPTAVGVMECLVADAWSVLNADGFWDWCDEYGITPSREAQETFHIAKAQTRNLTRLLGNDWEEIMNAEDVADYCD